MLTVAVSSRSLFHLEEANAIHEQQGQAAFDEFMIRTEDDPLQPGAAFSLVRKLLALNTPGDRPDRVDVVLLSRNTANAGLRVLNSVSHYKLPIEQAVFTGGVDRFRYALAMKADLVLCAEPEEARRALASGLAAACITPFAHDPRQRDHEGVHIAFDGDSVLFDEKSDQHYREHGLASFTESEVRNAVVPMGDGPFKRLLEKLCELQRSLPASQAHLLRTALITARSTPAHARPILTQRSWGINVDESMFTGGRPKGPFLRAFGADMFFDDTGHNIASAGEHGIPAGLVPTGASGIVCR